ncbi:hypothetical protein [Gordonia sp. NPDC058843]|uniref:hypothetical protein n=1 Tax=Gordonia sp. NPDC058843 TaxID=3346648 RepID=UPI0036C8B7CB
MTYVDRPGAWRGGRVIGILFVTLMAPAAGALAVTAIRAHDLPTVFVAAAFSLAVCVAAVGVVRTRVLERVQPDIDFAGGLITLRYDRLYDRLIRAALAVAAAGGIVFVVLVPMGKLDLSLTPGQRTFFPVAVGIIVVAAIYGEYARRKHGPPSVTLDEEAVTHHRTSSSTTFRWVDITRIEAERTEARPARDVVIVESVGDPARYVIGDAPWYTPGGATLYAMLRFYWLNPAARIELTDGRAFQRLSAEEFVDSGP